MKVALLAGGTGGAKLAHGFQQVLEPGDVAVIVNVADDADLYGLHVSPDIDSVLYSLAGLVNPETGWGVAGDTWTALGMLDRYGEPTWFRVGDADLATHVVRTRLLNEGLSLTDATARMASALGVASRILPASDDRLRTVVETNEGVLDFQDYFVRRRQEPMIRRVSFDGADTAQATSAALEEIAGADVVVMAPSNPIVSIGPILALPGVRDALAMAGSSVAVSPIVAGRALKGPADRMLAALGHESSALGVARLYAGLIGRFVLDEADADLAPAVEQLGMAADVLPTIMRDDASRAALARAILVRVASAR